MSDIKGTCHICGAIADKRCLLCGRAACDKHMNGTICTSCRSGKK